MTAIYAIVLTAGFIGLVAWIVAVALSASVEGKSGLDPETRFGGRGRMAIAAAVGFGMGGMSATFAGWAVLPSLVAAVGAGVLAVAIARYFGPTTDQAE